MNNGCFVVSFSHNKHLKSNQIIIPIQSILQSSYHIVVRIIYNNSYSYVVGVYDMWSASFELNVSLVISYKQNVFCNMFSRELKGAPTIYSNIPRS